MVVGVIATLVGLLLPALTTARRAARQAQCAGSLRQWAIAVNMYAAENRNWLPRRGQGKMPTQTLSWPDDWFNDLPGYLGQPTYQDLVWSNRMPQAESHSIWICPELAGLPNQFGNLFGYAMNMALSVQNAPQPDRIDRVGSASTMVFMTDGPAGYCSAVTFESTASDDQQRTVLKVAGDKHAYTLVGRIPFRTGRLPNNGLIEMVQGDPRLRRPYLVAVTNPQWMPGAHIDSARRFAAWLRTPPTQSWIAHFGTGTPDDGPVFFPVTLR
jgi:hypothetical protein